MLAMVRYNDDDCDVDITDECVGDDGGVDVYGYDGVTSVEKYEGAECR